MKAETRRRMNQTLALFAVLTGFALTSYWALRDSLQVPREGEAMTARDLDGAPARDLELAAMHARIDDLEADLAAREEELEELANALNGAVADRNEALQMLQALKEGRAR